MSSLFSIVQQYYEKGLYTDENVKAFFVAGKITEERIYKNYFKNVS